MPYKIMQCNLGRRRAAHDLINKAIETHTIDIVCVCEPNKNLIKVGGWIPDANLDAAIRVVNTQIEVEGSKNGKGWTMIQLKKFDLYCVYISPNISLVHYTSVMENMFYEIQKRKREIVMVGDINAKSPTWGGTTIDSRGEVWEDWIGLLDLVVHNDGKAPTFVRGESESFIDVTFSTRLISKSVHEWKVLEEENLTDHKHITFLVEGDTTQKQRRNTRKHINSQIFVDTLSIIAESRVEKSTETYLSAIKSAANVAFIEKKTSERGFAYWWNEEIGVIWKNCNRLKKLLMKKSSSRTAFERKEQLDRYKQARKSLKKEIRTAKKNIWSSLCSDLQNDPWGDAYKIVTKSLKKLAPYKLPESEKRNIIKYLFPKNNDKYIEQTKGKEGSLFTMEDLASAIAAAKSGKAPGLDEIPATAVRQTFELLPNWLLGLMNQVLKEQKFPAEWKQARVALIPKGGQSRGQPSSYRPISLLTEFSKVFERLIRSRLEEELYQRGGLNSRQYGFRKGKSTLDALNKVKEIVWKNKSSRLCILLTLDVKNAFNILRHSSILNELKRRNISKYLISIIASYLKNRTIEMKEGNDIIVYSGVPQGSVLGPTLWNLAYDGVLELDLGFDVDIIGYADDLALVIQAGTPNEMENKVHEATALIEHWLAKRGLALATHKTEAVLLKGYRIGKEIKLAVGNSEIKIAKSLVYLGVSFDHQGNFSTHINKCTEKAKSRVAVLNRLLRNVGGPNSAKRTVLAGVVYSTILYAAPIWSETALKMKKYRDKINSSQRQALLRVASAYRTVSLEALQVITGHLPIDIQARERANVFSRRGEDLGLVKAEERENAINEWQTRWRNNTGKAEWTKTLIPDLKEWLKCDHRITNYWMTQVLSGHGSFKVYTHRIGKEKDENCMYCGERDTVEHTLFTCTRWKEQRSVLHDAIGTCNTGTLIKNMLTSKSNWDRIMKFITGVMENKETEERQRQAPRKKTEMSDNFN